MTDCDFNFQGANFIVTGASSGIGRQITEELAAAGARGLAVARRSELLEQMHLANEFVIPGVADVGDYGTLKKVIENFVGQYGKINGGVYAAGRTGLTVLKGYDETEARRLMDISFWSGAKFVQICSKRSICTEGAPFIWVTSVAAQYPVEGLFAYSGAKAAAEMAVKIFAKELAPRKIRINSLCPGIIKTAMTEGEEVEKSIRRYIEKTPLGMGRTADVSGTALYLLSGKSAWMTGSTVTVAGGYTGA